MNLHQPSLPTLPRMTLALVVLAIIVLAAALAVALPAQASPQQGPKPIELQPAAVIYGDEADANLNLKKVGIAELQLQW